MHIKDIRVAGVKGLRQAALGNLGKINVICGKNNSGKSSILEALANEQHRFVGKTLAASDVTHVFDLSIKHTDWSGAVPAFGEYFRTLLTDVAALHQVWYSNESEEFVSEIQRRYEEQKGLFGKLGFPAGGLLSAYQTIFRQRLRTILVPPKREMELQKVVATGDAVGATGAGILNYLFYAKNQQTDHIARKSFDLLREKFLSISLGYSFDIFLGADNQLSLNFSPPGRNWVKAIDCGLGLQDLLVILYFSTRPIYDLLLIEEPESHMHPDMQRRLLSFLRDETDEKQFVLTTHSNIFVNSAMVDRVFFTWFENEVCVEDATSRTVVLNDLGYEVTDNLVSDIIILVEGPSDTPVVQELLVKKGIYSDYVIKIWPLGGDIMDQVDLSVFAERYTIIALLDQDPGSAAVRKRFIKKCEQLNVPYIRLERYAIENYFPVRVLREVFKGQIPPELDSLDETRSVEDQIGINVKRNNRKLAERLTLSDIQNTDLELFLNRVEHLCRSSSAHRGTTA